MVFCIFFGISYGMVGALQFEVLMTIVGTEKFSSAIGLVLLMEAMAVLVGPPGAGQSTQRLREDAQGRGGRGGIINGVLDTVEEQFCSSHANIQIFKYSNIQMFFSAEMFHQS